MLMWTNAAGALAALGRTGGRQFFSQERALASWRGLQERHPELLGDREPLIVRKQNRSLGTRPMINVRIPAPTRKAANELCGQLNEEGAACVVLKN